MLWNVQRDKYGAFISPWEDLKKGTQIYKNSVTMVILIHRSSSSLHPVCITCLLSPTPLLPSTNLIHTERGDGICCSHHALQWGNRKKREAASSRAWSRVESRLMVDEEAPPWEAWPPSPPGHLLAAASSVSLFLIFTWNENLNKTHAVVCRQRSRAAHRWTLPVDLKGQCSNPFRW